MDFFNAQEKARRNTGRLILYFAAAVAGTITVIYLILAFAFVARGKHTSLGDSPSLWNPQLFLWVAGGTSAAIFLGSLWKMAELRSGGGAVARSMGGRLLNHNTSDPDERKLVNIVEEMAIASGVPVPEIYVMDDEDGINAFAAGNTTSDAAIGVTRGCIQLLNRDELQGVIAHEFSHILNGDMRLNIRLMGVLFGILCIAIIGRILLETTARSRYYLGSRNKGGNPLPFIGIVLFVVGYIGIFFGKMIQSAISRQREYLADASAVQFTRNPNGISNALKKIGGLSEGSHISAPTAQEASHMFFGNAMNESFLNLTATHPPLADRIRAIEPSFDGKFPRITIQPRNEQAREAIEESEAWEAARPTPPRLPFPIPPPLPTQNILNQVGTLQPQNVTSAIALMADMPENLRAAARDTYGARALVYGLLLNSDSECRQRQLTALHAKTDAGVQSELDSQLPALEQLKDEARLPLAAMAIPSLRRMSQGQFEEFIGMVDVLIAADQQMDLFEYALQRHLKRHLWPHYRQQKRVTTQIYALKPLLPDCETLLSAIVNVGHDSPEAASQAFLAGVSRLGSEATSLSQQSLAQANLLKIDAALDRLATSSPLIKKQVLDACAYAVASDGQVVAREAELLRAIADSLDCPLPPLLPA